MKTEQSKIRNIAIIAHVDHGKTTLVDAMLKQSGTFRDNETVNERVMDSGDIERERGITILAKNTSIFWEDYKINIVDTPGHADFGGEVERSIQLADGVLLLVDAIEGCMPQTRFVLKKALALGLKVVIVVNKADRPNARPYEVVEDVLNLFLDLDATEEQFSSPVIFASGREGWASYSFEEKKENLADLFDLIIKYIPAPNGDPNGSFQMLVSNIDYNDYTGRIAVGKIQRGHAVSGTQCVICKKDGTTQRSKISGLYVYEGLKSITAEDVSAGEIIAISGLGGINIGETVCDENFPDPMPVIEVDKPVLSMNFLVNNSPFAGKEGKFVTSRHLRERLFKELESNVALRVEETDSTDTFKVSGRGELHLSVLIENMRRQGYEFQVSQPTVITTTDENGNILEPYEQLIIDAPNEYTGVVIERVSERKGEMKSFLPFGEGYSRIEFIIPTRGLIGYRNELLTSTRGTGILNSLFDSYQPQKGNISSRNRGSLVAWEDGEATAYGLFNAQDRGEMFISTGCKVYEGMIVGENSRGDDMVINVCKKKHLTAIRSTGADEALRLITPRQMTLERCLDFIAKDELLEVTPKNLRLRKTILKNDLRAKSNNKSLSV
ncbi:MAG: translational GTPase TypA [Oscillospiraceae bacterium]|nr:translational GTPase TypA [Oscillospiraceae bacterium]